MSKNKVVTQNGAVEVASLETFIIKGVEFFIHEKLEDNETFEKYVCSLTFNGIRISDGKTPGLAKSRAEEMMKKLTYGRIADAVANQPYFFSPTGMLMSSRINPDKARFEFYAHVLRNILSPLSKNLSVEVVVDFIVVSVPTKVANEISDLINTNLKLSVTVDRDRYRKNFSNITISWKCLF